MDEVGSRSRRTVESQQGQQPVDRSLPAARHIAGTRIGAANMRADRAAQPIRIGIEQKIVATGGALVDAGNRSADGEVGEGAAIECAPDHQLGLLLPCYPGACGFTGNPPPEAGNILGELPIDQIAAVAAKVPVIRQILWQEVAILFICGQQRAVCQQPIFVSVAEQKFAQRQQIGVVLIGLGAGNTRTIPIERRLRNSVGESERLPVFHIGVREDFDRGQSCGLRLLLHPGGERFDLVHARKQHQQDVRLVLSNSPTPVCRRICASIAQSPRAVVILRHAIDEFGRELLQDAGLDAQRLQAFRRKGDLADFSSVILQRQ